MTACFVVVEPVEDPLPDNAGADETVRDHDPERVRNDEKEMEARMAEEARVYETGGVFRDVGGVVTEVVHSGDVVEITRKIGESIDSLEYWLPNEERLVYSDGNADGEWDEVRETRNLGSIIRRTTRWDHDNDGTFDEEQTFDRDFSTERWRLTTVVMELDAATGTTFPVVTVEEGSDTLEHAAGTASCAGWDGDRESFTCPSSPGAVQYASNDIKVVRTSAGLEETKIHAICEPRKEAAGR